MLVFMLCGARDTDDVREEFFEVCRGFGAEGLHFVAGQIRHVNSATRTWEDNSRQSVVEANLCVFVVLRRYGEVTWMHEFTEAIKTGTPFLVLCLDDTWSKYRAVRDGRSTFEEAGIDDQLFTQLARVEDEQVTVVQFTNGDLAGVLRPQIASLVSGSLLHVQQRSRRAALATLLTDPDRLGPTELELTIRIAEDEAEEKLLRKHAISALAARRSGVPIATIERLLDSWEQGVQRAAAARLADLYIVRPPETEFLEMCVAVATAADDVGLARRLASTLLDIDLAAGISTLLRFDFDDVGLRRKIGAALERLKESLIAMNLQSAAADLGRRCLQKEAEQDTWKSRLRSLLDVLEPPEHPAAT